MAESRNLANLLVHLSIRNGVGLLFMGVGVRRALLKFHVSIVKLPLGCWLPPARARAPCYFLKVVIVLETVLPVLPTSQSSVLLSDDRYIISKLHPV